MGLDMTAIALYLVGIIGGCSIAILIISEINRQKKHPERVPKLSQYPPMPRKKENV